MLLKSQSSYLSIIQILQTKVEFTNEKVLSASSKVTLKVLRKILHVPGTLYYSTILVACIVYTILKNCTAMCSNVATVHFMAIILGEGSVPPVLYSPVVIALFMKQEKYIY